MKFDNNDHNFETFDLFCDILVTYWKEFYNDFRRETMKKELGFLIG